MHPSLFLDACKCAVRDQTTQKYVPIATEPPKDQSSRLLRNHAITTTTTCSFFRYHTASYGKVFHPGKVSGNSDFPVSWSQPPFEPTNEKQDRCLVAKSQKRKKRQLAGQRNLFCPLGDPGMAQLTLPDIQVRREASSFLSNWNSASPFFLAVGFYRPHVNFNIPKAHLRLFPEDEVTTAKYPHIPDDLPGVAYAPFHQLKRYTDVSAYGNVTQAFSVFPDELQRKIIRHYYAAVTYVDGQLGKLLSAVKESGHADDTVVSVIGDHGWNLGENGMFSKSNNFEHALRTPWMLHDPKRHPSLSSFEYGDAFKEKVDNLQPLEKVEEPVELLDLFPTLVDLAGLDPVEKCTNPLLEVQCTQGHSRSSKMTNERSSNNVAISQYPRPSLHPTLHSDMPPNGRTNYMGYTIRTTTHRYTEWVGYNISDYRPDRSRLVAQELYDHREDGEEHFNIAYRSSALEVKKELMERLRLKLKMS